MPVLKMAQSAAIKVLQKDAKLQKEENKLLRDIIKEKFEDRIEI